MTRLVVRDFGTALQFNGSTSKVAWTNTTGPALPAPTQPVTVACWFKLAADPVNAANSQPLINYGYCYMMIRSFGSGNRAQLQMRCDGGSAKIAVFEMGPNSDRNWHYAIGTLDASNGVDTVLQCWVDGVKVVSNNPAFQPTTNRGAGLAGSAAAGFFNGYLDNPRVWHGAISDADAQALYFNNREPTGLTPIVNFKFDEGSGSTAIDASGNGNNGTITAGTYTSDVPMKARSAATNRLGLRSFSAALAFTANTNIVNNLTGVVGFDTASTIAFWLRTGTSVTTGQRVASIALADVSTVLGVQITSGQLRAGYFNGSVYVTPKKKDIQPATWYHVVVTWDGSATRLYVNGIEETTASSNPSLSQGLGTRLSNTGAGITGNTIVATYAAWTRALSAAEILTYYRTGAYDATSLWLNWPLDDGSGTVARDISGNGRAGTITGATFTSDVPMKLRNLTGVSRSAA